MSGYLKLVAAVIIAIASTAIDSAQSPTYQSYLRQLHARQNSAPSDSTTSGSTAVSQPDRALTAQPANSPAPGSTAAANSQAISTQNDASKTSQHRLQHIAIPADQILRSLPREEKYIPIERKKWAEIEAKLGKETALAKENHSLHAAEHALEEIEWRAELKGTIFVGELICLPRRGPNTPNVATLEPWAFSGKDGYWKERKEPLVWGIDALGKTRVAVTHESQFVIPVRISCTEREDDLHLNVAFPSALSRRLVIRLPVRYKMSLDDGVLITQKKIDDQINEWTWQLTGSNALAMHLSVRPNTLTNSDTLIVAPKSIYTAGSRGMKLEWEVQLDSLSSAVERLPIEADAELSLISIASGDEALVYEEAPQSTSTKNKQDDATKTAKYFINFPAQFLKQPRTLKITATAQLVTEKLWRLPQIKIPGAIVTNHNTTLVTLAPYALEQLDLENCQQTHYEKLAAPASGEVTEIQTTGKGASINTVFRWRTPKGRWQSGMTMMTSNDKVVGKWIAEVNLDQGQLNQLDIEVDKGWEVDEISCETATMKGAFTKSQTQQRSTVNTFHFLRPFTAGETVRFAITARPAQSSNDVTLRGNAIELATVKHLRREQSFLKLALESEWQSTVTGSPTPSLLNDTQSKSISATLLAAPSYTHVPKMFLLPEMRSNWQFHASPFKEAFRTELVSALHVTDSRAKDLYEVRLKSGETKMNHVVVWFNEIRTEETVWELTQPRQLSVRSRRLKPSEQAELGFAESGEAWELNWAEPLDGDIVLVGERTFDLKNDISPVLVTLEPRFDQRGVLKFTAARQKFPSVVTAEKNSLPQLPFQENGQQGLLGSWEYLAKNRPVILQSEVPHLVLDRDEPNAKAKELIIWDSRLDSICVPKSPTQNILTVRIENPGLTNWKISLPRGATLRNARVNGATAKWHRPNSEKTEYTIEILPTARFIIAQLVWSNETDQGHWSLSSTAEWPSCREKFLAREWYVWSPQDYQPMWKQNFEQIVPPAVQTYWERLLGPVIPSSNGGDRNAWWIFSSRNESDYGRISSTANDRLKSNSAAFFAILQNQLDAAASHANASQINSDLNDVPNSDSLELNESPQPLDSGAEMTWSTVIDNAWQRSFRQNAAGIENLWIDGAALADLGIQPALAPNSLLASSATSKSIMPLDLLATDSETLSQSKLQSEVLSINSPRQKSVAVSKNIVLLALPDGWLLTTRHGLSLWPEPRLLPNCERMYYCNLTQTEMDSLAFSSSSILDGHLYSLSQWRDSANKSASPWVEGLMQSHDQIPTSWLPRQVRQEYLNAGAIHLVHGPSLSAWRIGVFVITLGLSTFWIVWRAPFKIMLYGIVALVAVAIPWGLSPLGNGVVWGMIVGQILRWLNCWPWRGWRTSDVVAKRSSPRDENTSQSSIRRLAGNIVPAAIFIAVLWAQNLFAQNDNLNDRTAQSDDDLNVSVNRPEKIWTVFVPVDEKTQPTGDYVYVPAQLWDEVQSRADQESKRKKAEQATNDQQWFLAAANYTGEITHSNASASANSAAWRLEMQLHTLTDNVWVSLPFIEQEIVLIPSEFKLDDQEANWRWSDQRKSIEISVKKTGSHRLNLQFQPQPRESRPEIDLDFKIPLASHNEFTIRAHGDMQLSPLMAGEWSWDAEQQVLRGTTGPLAQIALDYQLKDAESTTATKIELEVMQWLKLRAASANLDVRVSRVLNGQLKKLEFEVDPRLKLIPTPPNANNPSIVHQTGNLVRIEFQRPQSERTAIDLSFLITDYELNKPFTVPRIQVKQHDVKTSWLFASLEHGIDVFYPPRQPRKPSKELKKIEPTEVERLWLDETNAPKFAFHIDNPNYDWSFIPGSASPIRKNPQTATRISVTPSETIWNCTVTFQIDQSNNIDRSSNYWTLRGIVPDRVQIDSVQLKRNGQVTSARWSIGEARHLAIFPETPPTGAVELQINGRFPTVFDTEQQLQHFQLEGTYPPDTISLERDPKTLVQASWEAGWKNVSEKKFLNKELELNNAHLASGLAPLLQSVVSGKSTDAGYSLKVTANPNDAKITLISTLQKRDDGWYVVYDFLGNSTEGQLDQFAFQAPSSLLEPKTPEASTRLIRDEQVSTTTQNWLVRPAKSWIKQWSQRIEFRIAADPLKLLQLPRPRLLSHRAEKEFFIVPDKVNGIELNWVVRGTSLAELPADYQTILTPANEPIIFVARSPRMNVQIQLIEPVKAQSVVHLADYGLNWQKSVIEVDLATKQRSEKNHRSWKVNGVAHFHVDPNGAKSCIMELPPNCTLIDGKTAGTATPWKKLKETEWEASFSDTLLPQHISVIFSISLDANLGTEQLALKFPRIKNLPVDQTLVTNWSSNQLQVTNPLARTSPPVNSLTPTPLAPTTVANSVITSTPSASSQPLIAPSTAKPRWLALDVTKSTLQRLDILLRVIEKGMNSSPPTRQNENFLGWYRESVDRWENWLSILKSNSSIASNNIATGSLGNEPNQLEREITRLENGQLQLAKNGYAALLQQSITDAEIGKSTSDTLWLTQNLEQGDTQFWSFAGSVDELSLSVTEAPDTYQQTRWLLVVAGLLTVSLASVIAARLQWNGLEKRHRIAVLLAICVIWWWWFQPREIALFLALIAGLIFWIQRLDKEKLSQE